SCSDTPNPANPNQSVRFDATAWGGSPPYTWSWSGSPGSWSPAPANGQSPTYTFLAAGSYTATVTVRDALRSASYSCPASVTGNTNQDFTIVTPKAQTLAPGQYVSNLPLNITP